MDRKVKTGFTVFYVLSLIIVGFILYNTVNHSTIQAISGAKFSYLALAAVVTVIFWYSDYLRLKVLARGLGERFPVKMGMELVFANAFFSAVTPFAVGGGPLQVYMMNRTGIPVAKGIAMTAIRFVQNIFFLGVLTPLILILRPDLIGDTHMKYFFAYTVTAFTVIGLFYFVVIVWPDKTKVIGAKVIRQLHRMHLIKEERAENWRTKLFGVVDEFSTSIRSYFGRAKWYLIGSYLLSLIYFLAQFAIPGILMLAFNLEIEMWDIILSQVVLTSMMYFMPTPGSSGIAEGGFFLIFIRYVPKHLLGVLIFLWRFFVTYLAVLIGSYVFLKLLGDVTMKTIMNFTKKEENES